MDNSIPEGIMRLTRQRDEAVNAFRAERARADQAERLREGSLAHLTALINEQDGFRAALQKANALIIKAPHGDSFCEAGSDYGQAECICWKSQRYGVDL